MKQEGALPLVTREQAAEIERSLARQSEPMRAGICGVNARPGKAQTTLTGTYLLVHLLVGCRIRSV